jgi:hypothetical protein
LDNGIRFYFASRQLDLKDPALLKAHISEKLRQQFDGSRVADQERANAVAQFNRLCDVLEKM